MALQKKKRQVDPQEVISRISKDTMDFTESLNNPTSIYIFKYHDLNVHSFEYTHLYIGMVKFGIYIYIFNKI